MIDYKKLKALYDSGCSDSEIASRLCCSLTTVEKWRKEKGLVHNIKKVRKKNTPIDYDKVRKLYCKGLSDLQISKVLGCSRYSIYLWRKNNDLLKESYCSKFRELYDKGLSDQQIAEQLGCSRDWVSAWRFDNNLIVREDSETYKYTGLKYDKKLFIELYDKGLYDNELAEGVGCALTTVKSWRKDMGLKSNRKRRYQKC